ncbi:hypothetical protein [Achromobacter phage Motura]|uniref:Uncharacterized protein n=1 Tax=Achromobacter phage Motura TaxID=2591403 RepID=A0A514CSU3_9CAUD|nr:hypothetical protein H1O15_gp252 [Achromobacter phage Motura]QDH83536.1 hypothetical protein [Achromobacter phage Motura]
METQLQAIKNMISDYFGDTSRPAHETREGLEDIASHLDSLLDVLPSDDDADDSDWDNESGDDDEDVSDWE